MGVDGSIPPSKFFNNVQAEILHVITGAGLTPSDTDLSQLREAILAMIPPPAGGPSDASLVHFGADTGAQNQLVITPLPSATSVAPGFTIFTLPAYDISNATGFATLTINLAGGGSVTKPLVAFDNTTLRPGLIRAGTLIGALYDGTSFRVISRATLPVADGITIIGDSTAANPFRLPAAVRAGGVWNNNALTGSFGVASVLHTATGWYTVTLSAAMPDINYIVSVTPMGSTAGNITAWVLEGNHDTRTVNSFQIFGWGIIPLGQVASDANFQFAVFR